MVRSALPTRSPLRLLPSRAWVQTPERVLTTILLFGCLAYAVVSNLPGSGLSTAAALGYPLLFLIGLASMVTRVVRVPRQRWQWSILALAILSGVAGNIYYIVAVTEATRSWPSWTDLGRLGCVGFGLAALIVHLQSRLERHRATMLMDVFATALLMTAVGMEVLPPVMNVDGMSTLAALAHLLYPVGDLMLTVTALAGVVLLGRVPDRQMIVLLMAIPSLGVGDYLFLAFPDSQIARGSISELTLLVTLLLVCWGACLEAPAERIGSQGGARAVLQATVPIIVGLTSLVLLSPLAASEIGDVARWFAVLGLVAVGVRTVVTTREITTLMEERDESHVDHLTGLLNRRGMLAHLARTLDEARSEESTTEHLALLLLDIDQFKEVNDSLGHHQGDAVIAALAERLAGSVIEPLTRVARMGGDEFAVVAHGVTPEQATRLAQSVIDMLHEPVEVDDIKLELDVSIGVCVADPSHTQVSDMLRWADISMYRAKATRGGYCVYDPSFQDEEHEERLRMLADLRVALSPGNDGRCGEMVLFYQPKIELSTGRVTGSEALIRWRHPQRGLVFPDRFLPLADDAGLMPRITETVLGLALEQASVWWAEGQQLSVAVNLPSAAIVDSELPTRIAAALDATGLPAAALVLEITEESLLSDRVRARVVLAKLRALGVTVSIDDYGTGYSSLAYLRELPVDELKLDRSFVFPMSDDERAAAIVRSTVALAHSLGLRIVAEGVEHESAAEQLGAYGCDHAQGYHYSKPVPAADFTSWVTAHHSALSATGDLTTGESGGNLPSPRRPLLPAGVRD